MYLQGTDIISTLYAAHSAPSNNPNIGVNVDDAENPILDSVKEGILDSLLSKHWAIKYATEAALTVLRIDQIIMVSLFLISTHFTHFHSCDSILNKNVLT